MPLWMRCGIDGSFITQFSRKPLGTIAEVVRGRQNLLPLRFHNFQNRLIFSAFMESQKGAKYNRFFRAYSSVG